MFIYKYKEFEVIFDSEEIFNTITENKKRSIWVDRSNKNSPYARMSYYSKNIRIHHFIMGTPLNKLLIGHLNGNSLDNRTCNLKVVSRSENNFNKTSFNSKRTKRWVTKEKNGKYSASLRIRIGVYETEEEAHKSGLEFFKKFYPDYYLHKDFI